MVTDMASVRLKLFECSFFDIALEGRIAQFVRGSGYFARARTAEKVTAFCHGRAYIITLRVEQNGL